MKTRILFCFIISSFILNEAMAASADTVGLPYYRKNELVSHHAKYKKSNLVLRSAASFSEHSKIPFTFEVTSDSTGGCYVMVAGDPSASLILLDFFDVEMNNYDYELAIAETEFAENAHIIKYSIGGLEKNKRYIIQVRQFTNQNVQLLYGSILIYGE